MNISFELRQTIGMQFVLDRMQPCTPYGDELVKNLYYYTPEQKSELEKELENVDLVYSSLQNHKNEYEQIKLVMTRMKDIRRSLQNCLEKICLSQVEFFEIKRFLIQLGELLPVFSSIEKIKLLDGIKFDDLREVLELIDPNNPDRIGFFISDNRSERLSQIRIEKKRIEMQINKAVDREEKDDLKLLRQGICIKEDDEEQAIREELTLALIPYADKLLANIKSIGRFDFILQKAQLAAEFNGVKPIIVEEAIIMKDMVNPQVQELLKEKQCEFTPVCIELVKGVTVITGANMGGKSIALKTLALNAILAHAGFFSFAGRVELPILHSVQCIFDSAQSLEKGLSGFAAEIIDFKAALQEVEKGFSLFLLDEFARGTNPDEGAMIVKGVARYLNGKNAITVMATHYDNITQEGNAHYQVIGLQKMDREKVMAQLEAEPGNSLAIIARYMDYGLYRVYGKEDCPKDALNICRLLELDSEIISHIEQLQKTSQNGSCCQV